MTDKFEQYIGKSCIIYSMNQQVNGTVLSIEDGWISLDNGKEQEMVNLDYVTRIREYPRNKRGAKKGVVLD